LLAVNSLPLPTTGGQGGAIVKVTSLDNDGDGSLRDALRTPEPAIIVFEVGGVIDLEMQTLVLSSPHKTVAGHTAPAPGITLVRGGISVQTNDVIIRHIRVRPGEAGQEKGSGWNADGLSTSRGAHRVAVDNCSFTWGTDENLAASGPRFDGKNVDEWRENTSHDILLSRNIIAEGLSYSTHDEFEHSKGLLVHDNVTGLLVVGNLFAHNLERSPLLKGGVHATLVNNLIYNPGNRAMHYNLLALEWAAGHPFVNGRLTSVGNVLRGGPSTRPGLPLLMIGGQGDLDYFGSDNLAIDWRGVPLPLTGRYTTSSARIIEHAAPLDWPEDLTALPAQQTETWVAKNVGARPWDRDMHDRRVVGDAMEGLGKIIDSEQEVGGYPVMTETRRTFDPQQWDLDSPWIEPVKEAINR
jgi:pectate lyase